ncbi:MAG: hypothetical protein B7X04_00805 [Parcubacteria group bacterium 21-54-25]|nr:MAG: hypothetical protein B7X04_00805 [Parcubacteria group bacterium 21-54-25]HQU07950.1 hypothetical protein [Candidatus Paceibacterota bacterium]
MHNTSSRSLPFTTAARAVPVIPTLTAIASMMVIAYIGLLAIAMTYGALQMQAAQSVRDTNAVVGTLETSYLAAITAINQTNPTTLGFTKPVAIAYVTGSSPQQMVSLRTP